MTTALTSSRWFSWELLEWARRQLLRYHFKSFLSSFSSPFFLTHFVTLYSWRFSAFCSEIFYILWLLPAALFLFFGSLLTSSGGRKWGYATAHTSSLWFVIWKFKYVESSAFDQVFFQVLFLKLTISKESTVKCFPRFCFLVKTSADKMISKHSTVERWSRLQNWILDEKMDGT